MQEGKYDLAKKYYVAAKKLDTKKYKDRTAMINEWGKKLGSAD